jgi:hypothetical protein
LLYNPKGIALYSPRLPSIARLPWVNRANIFNRNAVAHPRCFVISLRNRVAVDVRVDGAPKVARMRATLGFRAESR